MQTTHTPGPWNFAKSDIDGRYSIYGNGPLAYCGDTGAVDGDGEANARLIAAAPDLLAALQTAENALRYSAQEAAGRVRSEIVGGWLYHADQCRAAIAKATGGQA